LGSSANEAVENYLTAQLAAMGVSPQSFPAIGIYNGSRRVVIADTHDIVGRIPGTANSRAIMLVAHYDSVYRAPGAADDGAAVAAILETIRALRARPALKNDVIVLLTDGEEAGLLGAEAFAAAHPWIKDVGLIMNFEARGNQGPSMLFETSENNGLLISGTAQSAPHAIGSSLFYALYKLLPNDTDFSVFRQYKIPGLNFAFGENLEAYHSKLDSVENLSAASLQHHGSYGLSLTEYFGRIDLNQLQNSRGDDVFFNWLGDHLIVYGEGWVFPIEILASILLIGTILLSLRSGVRMARILLAVLPSLTILLAVPVVLVGAHWLLSRLLNERLIVSDSQANLYLLAGFVLLGAGVGSLLFTGFRNRFSVQELSLAGLIIVGGLSWAVALALPAGSYLLVWPFLLITLGLLVITLQKKSAQSNAQAFASIAGTAVTILLFAPLIYLLYMFLTLQMITIAAIGLLIGLFFLLGVPFMNVAVPQGRWRSVVLLLLVCGLMSFGIGATLSRHTAQHPWHDSIVYSMNADNHSAVWISYDRSPDKWTAQFFSNQQPQSQPRPDCFAGWQRLVLSAPASPFDLAPPVAEIKTDETESGVRKIRMNVRSQRSAGGIFITFEKDIRPLSVRIGAREIAPNENSGLFSMSLLGMGAKGADLELAFKTPSKISFWLMDQSFQLPTETQPRPDDITASDGSDLTLVCRKYSY
jgi:hypothetical protein